MPAHLCEGLGFTLRGGGSSSPLQGRGGQEYDFSDWLHNTLHGVQRGLIGSEKMEVRDDIFPIHSVARLEGREV